MKPQGEKRRGKRRSIKSQNQGAFSRAASRAALQRGDADSLPTYIPTRAVRGEHR